VVGIFGNKQSTQQYQDQPIDPPVDMSTPPAPAQPASIDGVIPTYQDSPATPSQDPTPASPVDENNDAGDYIMADPPVPTANNWDDQAVHQHDEIIDSAPVDTPTPVEEPEPAPEPEAPAEEGTVASEAVQSVPSTHPLPSNDTVPSDLQDIREQALKQLSPLVSHLDQSPEERFHTAMMMLQATDDHSLVKTAYEAAQEISDDKAKAQALLDIVNEINYFTQNKTS